MSGSRGLSGACLTAAGLLLAACAGTPAALQPTAVRQLPAAGYLSPAELRSLADAVPPPPEPGSAAAAEDRLRSDSFRALEDGDRWLLATAHAELRPPLALQHFDCVLGVRFASARTPALTRMAQRLFADADAAAERVKARAFRPRPVGEDPARRSCQRINAAGRSSPSYPSGSAAVAAVYAEALAEIDPGRASEVRGLGREIALSRVVCGMHYPTDVQAGEALGRAVFETARGSAGFRSDLETARAELAAARASGLTSPACAAERAALASRLP